MVCEAISEISETISPILSADWERFSRVRLAVWVFSTAFSAIWVEWPTWWAISATDLPISSVEAATMETLAVACSAAAATCVERSLAVSAVEAMVWAALSSAWAPCDSPSTTWAIWVSKVSLRRPSVSWRASTLASNWADPARSMSSRASLTRVDTLRAAALAPPLPPMANCGQASSMMRAMSLSSSQPSPTACHWESSPTLARTSPSPQALST